MATVFGRPPGGVVFRFLRDEEQERLDRLRRPGSPPAGTTTFEFDEGDHAALVQEIQSQPDRFRVPANDQLTRDGLPVAAPDGVRRVEWKLLKQALNQLASLTPLSGAQLGQVPAAVAALNAGTATLAQVQLLQRAELLLLRGVVRRLAGSLQGA